MELKLPPNLQTSMRNLLLRLKVVGKHFYFIFIMLLVIGLGVCVYATSQALQMTDEAYREQKTLESARSFRLREDKATVDKVLQLNTANTGPIEPNYDPDRDNPFVEN